MTNTWTITKAHGKGRRGVGPWPDEDTLPETFTATAVRGGLRATIAGGYDGTRVRISSLLLDGRDITPRDLPRVKLGEIVRTVLEELGTAQNLAHVGRYDGPPTDEEGLRLMAAVYIWHQVTHSEISPREAVKRHWNLSDRAAKYHLGKAEAIYPPLAEARRAESGEA